MKNIGISLVVITLCFLGLIIQNVAASEQKENNNFENLLPVQMTSSVDSISGKKIKI